jgi:hypothetical protein
MPRCRPKAVKKAARRNGLAPRYVRELAIKNKGLGGCIGGQWCLLDTDFPASLKCPPLTPGLVNRRAPKCFRARRGEP